MRKIGVIGHRFFAGKDIKAFVADQCRSILRHYRDRGDCIAAISALAEGADSIFAEEALALNIPLETVRPFEAYAGDFVSTDSKALYVKLRSLASCETVLPYKKRTVDAYYDAMQWVIKHAELLVIIWDGDSAKQNRGGTADAIKYIVNKQWIHIDVTNRRTLIYYQGNRYLLHHSSLPNLWPEEQIMAG